MRLIMVISFTTTLVLSAWAHNLRVADAGQASKRATINPIGMMASASDLPVQQFDAF